MKSLFRVLYWIVSLLVVLALIGLGLKLARALIGVAILVGVAAVVYALFAKPKPATPSRAGR